MVVEIFLGWLGEIATVKIAEAVIGGVSSKLNPGEIDKYLKNAIKNAQEQNQYLFYSCEPRLIPKFLNKFLETGLEELRKPLNNQGKPDIDFLVKAFNQELENYTQIKQNIKSEQIKPWLEIFINSYFSQTASYLKFQVAKEDYLKQLANWFDDVKFAGIAVESQEIEKSEKLAQIFVMPDVLEDVKGQNWDDFELLMLNEQELSRIPRQQANLLRNSPRKFNAEQLLKQSNTKRVVLLGAPGSGKTTLLSYFAVMLAQNHHQVLGIDANADILPILIRIRDLARKSEVKIIDYAREFAEKTMAVKDLPLGFFEHWLDNGQALILLDGLDEVAEESQRYHIVSCIENFLGQYEQNRVIITSRPAGYKRDFFRTEEFSHYRLELFNNDQIEEFINRWYDNRVQDTAEAARRKDGLRKALDGNNRIKLIARNPLLLTIIALIHRYQAVLPKERYKLYDKAVETLLTSWDANKELTNQSVLKYLKFDDLRRLMESIAYWIHSQGNGEKQQGGTLIEYDDLIEKLAQDIKKTRQIELYEAKNEAKRFVEFIRERTGLLNEQGQDYYAFVHKTFQEYLCAQEIAYRADNEDDFAIILNHIKDHLHDSHWQEVILLLVAQQKPKKAAKAIRSILDAGSKYEQWLHRDLFLAATCLAEYMKNLEDFELSQEILTRLVALEIKGSEQIGRRIYQQTFESLCQFSETVFEVTILELLQQQATLINQERLQKYQVELGQKEIVIQSLLQSLQDNNFRVRYNAVEALGKLGNNSEQVINALLQSLQDNDYVVHCTAAKAIGELGNNSEQVINALLQSLQAQDAGLHFFVAEALGKLGNNSEQVINALLQLLQDQNDQVHSNAVEALGKLGQKSQDLDLLSTIEQWIKQHPDSEYVVNGIDVLWDLVVGEQN